MGEDRDHQGEKGARWRRQLRALATPRTAIPVYTPKDYPHIREQPGADDMPATWEEWAVLFDASQIRRAREGQFYYDKVRIRPDLFKAWLDANSLSASERSRQLYAQELNDARAARRIASEQERLAREKAERVAVNAPPPPAPWSHRAIEACALILFATAVSSDVVVGAMLATSTGFSITKKKRLAGSCVTISLQQ
ncbi:hypothetical protein [Mesorhizobium sp. LjNodule214]|uniref:hypothetical protein n=1 Tax=Mesorhizobium sp. LjNodule214 TaxID=3342252 RepID=UPI003ECE50C7